MLTEPSDAYASGMRFRDAVLDAFSQELLDATGDTGPLDTLSANELDRVYDEFYGTSPLSSPCSSATPSRAASPVNFAPSNALKRKASSSPEPHRSVIQSTSKSRRDKRKSKSKRKLARTRTREAAEASQGPLHPATPRDASVKKHIEPADAHATEYSAGDIPCASTGFKAMPDKKGRVHTLEELRAMGFTLVPWDARKSKPVLDAEGRVIAVLVGKPDDPDWDAVHMSAFEELQDAAHRCRFTKKSASHRRGEFPALNAGISFGGGQMAPGNLCHSPHRRDTLDGLVGSSSFKRLAGFASSAFCTWMPKLHHYYSDSFKRLLMHHGALRRNFNNSVWAAAAFNFGPQTVTARHRDFANLPFGVCAVTALGRFNPTLGGHLVLWEMGLVVEFPPGSTVLLPSAAISHSNTPVGAHEQRASFTQYTAGGLFRWVEQGFQTSYKFMSALTDEERLVVDAQNAERCKLGLSLFSKLSDLSNQGSTGKPPALLNT